MTQTFDVTVEASVNDGDLGEAMYRIEAATEDEAHKTAILRQMATLHQQFPDAHSFAVSVVEPVKPWHGIPRPSDVAPLFREEGGIVDRMIADTPDLFKVDPTAEDEANAWACGEPDGKPCTVPSCPWCGANTTPKGACEGHIEESEEDYARLLARYGNDTVGFIAELAKKNQERKIMHQVLTVAGIPSTTPEGRGLCLIARLAIMAERLAKVSPECGCGHLYHGDSLCTGTGATLDPMYGVPAEEACVCTHYLPV